jgi:hypothetical protein
MAFQQQPQFAQPMPMGAYGMRGFAQPAFNPQQQLLQQLQQRAAATAAAEARALAAEQAEIRANQKAYENPNLMWYLFNQGNIMDSNEATLWNMGAANTFGGDIPDSAMLFDTVKNGQTAGDSNINALMTVLGMGQNPYYNGVDGFVDPTFMGSLLKFGGAVPNFNDNYLSTLMTSGNLGLGSYRSPMSPFGIGQFSNLGMTNGVQTNTQSFQGQMALASGMLGTGIYPGGFRN